MCIYIGVYTFICPACAARYNVVCRYFCSSPEDNHHQTPALEENHEQAPAPVPSLVAKVTHGEMEEQTHLDSKLGVEIGRAHV